MRGASSRGPSKTGDSSKASALNEPQVAPSSSPTATVPPSAPATGDHHRRRGRRAPAAAPATALKAKLRRARRPVRGRRSRSTSWRSRSWGVSVAMSSCTLATSTSLTRRWTPTRPSWVSAQIAPRGGKWRVVRLGPSPARSSTRPGPTSPLVGGVNESVAPAANAPTNNGAATTRTRARQEPVGATARSRDGALLRSDRNMCRRATGVECGGGGRESNPPDEGHSSHPL